MTAAIHISNLKKAIGKREILKAITFDVERGDVFGYLGPNGAGKTTTIRVLLGLLRADSGEVSILGHDIGLASTRMMIGFALDPDGLYDSMTARENLKYYADIYGVARATASIDRVLVLVGLADRSDDRVGTFSRGMRQRLSLARALVHDPEVLILDEPTAGVDPTGQIEIRALLQAVAHTGKTVLLSSHNLDEVQRICNRVALIDRGQIRLYGELDGLRQKMGRGMIEIEASGGISASLLAELGKQTQLGYRETRGASLLFESAAGTAEVPEIVGYLTERGVKIESAVRHQASLEDLYASILKDAGQT